jgi:predicted nucleotidyltransferase
MTAVEDLLRPPSEAEVRRALGVFSADVRRHYGGRHKGLYLFGSRARGDHSPDSDADVAVLLEDSEWKTWSERHVLSDLAYDRLLEDGVYIQGWPVRLSVWENPEFHNNPSLVRAMKRDAKPLEPNR